MYVVMIASECAPVAKVGGLGDVVFGLSRELEMRGNAVEIILPKYDCMRYDQIYGLQSAYEDLWVPWYGGAIHCTVWFGFVARPQVLLHRAALAATTSSTAAPSTASATTPSASPSSARRRWSSCSRAGKRPDIIHCHDWQTALVPVLLYEIYQHVGHARPAGLLHDPQLQPPGRRRRARSCGRPGLQPAASYFCTTTACGDDFNPGAINLMKGGDRLLELRHDRLAARTPGRSRYTDQGCGLGHTLHVHQRQVRRRAQRRRLRRCGTRRSTRCIPRRYGADDARRTSTRNKHALRERFWLRDDYKPIVAYVGRLDGQKGVHLIQPRALLRARRTAPSSCCSARARTPASTTTSGTSSTTSTTTRTATSSCGFNEELAHLIYAGADLLVVPSLFEPCGLTQMIALQATAPCRWCAPSAAWPTPCSTATTPSVPPEQRNGYVFHHADHAGARVGAATARSACGTTTRGLFRELMLNGMRCDYSWDRPGPATTCDIYDHIRHK